MIFYEVRVTQKADLDEQSVYKYISEKFGEIYAEKFRAKLIKTFQTLAKYPFIGRVAKNDKSLRVLIINKRNKLVYKIIESEIVIVRLMDMRTKSSGKY